MPALFGTHTCRKTPTARLDMVQRRAARFVTNSYSRTTGVTNIIQQLGWLPLQERRRHARLIMFYKIHKGKVHMTTEHLLPPSRLTRNMHPLSYQVPSCSSDYRKFSFYPRTIRDWNGLPAPVAESESLEMLGEEDELLSF